MEGGDCRLSGTAAPPYLPRHGCRQFIHASMTLNRNGKNVHAGIDRESFPNHRVDILKILVISYGCNMFAERACSGMARAERRCSYWPERDAQLA